jgi:Virulence activator alpha C-term
MHGEALRKLFFSDLLGREVGVANLGRRRASMEKAPELFRGSEADAGAKAENVCQRKTLRCGIEVVQWMVDWCAQAERELGAG